MCIVLKTNTTSFKYAQQKHIRSHMFGKSWTVLCQTLQINVFIIIIVLGKSLFWSAYFIFLHFMYCYLQSRILFSNDDKFIYYFLHNSFFLYVFITMIVTRLTNIVGDVLYSSIVHLHNLEQLIFLTAIKFTNVFISSSHFR